MNDLTKGYGAGPETAGRSGDATPVEGAGWFVPETDPAEMDPWIAFMRGDEPPSRRAVPQAKKPRVLIGLRKKGRHQQLANP
jgi:hypothetical protein